MMRIALHSRRWHHDQQRRWQWALCLYTKKAQIPPVNKNCLPLYKPKLVRTAPFQLAHTRNKTKQPRQTPSELQRAKKRCRVVEREARVWEREEPRGTGRFSATTSRGSPNLRFGVWPEEVESRGLAVSSTRKPVVCWRSSSRMLFAMRLPTPSTLGGRPSLPWTLSTHSRGRVGPSTGLVVDFVMVWLGIWNSGQLALDVNVG